MQDVAYMLIGHAFVLTNRYLIFDNKRVIYWCCVVYRQLILLTIVLANLSNFSKMCIEIDITISRATLEKNERVIYGQNLS